MEEIKILSIGIADAFLGVFMGMLAGAALTLMDRIDEHHIIQRHRTFLAYLAAFFSAVSTILAIEWFPVIYPFAFGLSLLWIFKNKIDFPSHVFSLFLMAIYFGLRIDLFWLYAPLYCIAYSIAIYLRNIVARSIDRAPGVVLALVLCQLHRKILYRSTSCGSFKKFFSDPLLSRIRSSLL